MKVFACELEQILKCFHKFVFKNIQHFRHAKLYSTSMASTRMVCNVGIFFLIFTSLGFTLCFDCTNSEEKLQVHLVPHTHDDVGWKKTVDQYYYGQKLEIHEGFVRRILDSSIVELQKDAHRTFIYVEMAFFKKWWDEQNDEVKNVVKTLVRNKQFEFINGGWSMNDEGATHYNGIIDQMTLGLLFIEENFGSEARPTIAWQIDPFGHSAEQASMFSLMSMNGLFFGRLDEADKEKRKKEQRMEMAWRGSRNYAKQSQIFTGVLYNLYQPPDGFCFDHYCQDAEIIDDKDDESNNVKDRVDTFVKETCEQAKHYKTNHIMLTMGSDFHFENARKWYSNLDKLIIHTNEDGRVHAFYSTPSRYLKALHEANKQWEVKTDDFFPYAHCEHCYWTGYFTSRPTLKGYIRESNNILQACKQMESFSGLVDSPSSQLLREAVALNQHHDAVTGTEKQPVADDYTKRLYIGREECKTLMNKYIIKQINKGSGQPITLSFTQCDYLNVSMCHITETEDSFVLNVYNPIGRKISTYIRIPVNSRTYVVSDSEDSHGTSVPSQIASVSMKTSSFRKESHGSALYELTFEVSAPALGYATYFIKKTNQNNQQTREGLSTLSEEKQGSGDQVIIENDLLKLEFSPETGRLLRMRRKDEDLHLDVDQQFFWYNASTGNDESIQTSGAYIFRPSTNKPVNVSPENNAKIYITKGPVYEEIHQTFGPYVNQTIRLYKHVNYAEFEHTVGPIPVDDGHGKEIITRFDTGIESAGKFYTDANGREMKERIRDHRETWKLNITEPVAGNYYPVNSRILINDSNAQLTVMSDRSQGGSSIRDGSIEIMVHRRLLRDDFLGVNESLNELGITGDGLVTRGKHRVLLSKPKDGAKLHRENGEFMMMAPILRNEYDIKRWNEIFAPSFSGLTKPLPDNVHLLTVESIKRDEIILRFENYYEKFERDEVAEVDLDGLFKAFKITKLTEMNLSANQKLSEKKMWSWNTGEEQFHEPSEDRSTTASLVIRLKPMEIRTYRAKIEHNALPSTLS